MIAVTLAHAAALAAIHAAAFPPGQAWTERALAELLAMPGAFGWLDPRGGFVLARAVAGEAEVLTLAVAPESRRLGIARGLLARAMAAVAPMPWFLEVDAGNAAARGLYAATGFTPCGLRQGYYAGGADALVLRRPAPDSAVG